MVLKQNLSFSVSFCMYDLCVHVYKHMFCIHTYRYCCLFLSFSLPLPLSLTFAPFCSNSLNLKQYLNSVRKFPKQNSNCSNSVVCINLISNRQFQLFQANTLLSGFVIFDEFTNCDLVQWFFLFCWYEIFFCLVLFCEKKIKNRKAERKKR